MNKQPNAEPESRHEATVALLTGGGDRPYVYGLAMSLLAAGVRMDLLGSDELNFAEFRNLPGLNFFNLRRDVPQPTSFPQKAARVGMHYLRLIGYAATARPKVFHILWNTKFELFDRTVLMLYYRLLGKRIALTAHNVNFARRDGGDNWLNRITLRLQYRLAHHLFVHTEKMKQELLEEFGVDGARVSVIPFGINNAVPNTTLTPAKAKRRLGIRPDEKILLSFGRITPYKGFEHLIAAFRQLRQRDKSYRLIIAGRVDRCEKYWQEIREDLRQEEQSGQVLLKDDFIPDEETEVYFKAADALVLAYTHIYQSGVLFLGHSFGLPVLASNVGSFKEEIVAGQTGFVFQPQDPEDLANTIERYFASDLYTELSSRRSEIKAYAAARHSWEVVAGITKNVYAKLGGTAIAEKKVFEGPVRPLGMQEDVTANSKPAF